MLILGIETTCDETSISIVKDGCLVISNIISSQANLHAKYGGVIPEIASRLHLEKLPIVLDECVELACKRLNISKEELYNEIKAIAIATHPGLPPALSVGLSYASGLAISFDKPLLHINHLKAHVWANFLRDFDIGNNQNYKSNIPEQSICLLVSGGHTQLLKLININDKFEIDIIGETHDDAAGEAYDKVARLLNMPYPGGPNLEKMANIGHDKYMFPRPLLQKYFKKGTGWDPAENYNFSFSGIKSAVADQVDKEFTDRSLMSEQDKANIAKGFQDASIEVLVQKTIQCAIDFGVEYIYLAGGVACNQTLRDQMKLHASEVNIKVSFPKPIYCTDNAAMIAGYAINLV